MKIASNLPDYHEPRRIAAEGRLPQLRRAPGDAEPFEHETFGLRIGKISERPNVARRSCRFDQDPPERRSRANQLQADAFAGRSDRSGLGALDDRQDVGAGRKALN